jgi:predicted O-methyltransferase YrrM
MAIEVEENPGATLTRIRAVAATIDGWLSESQGRALYDAAATTTGRGAIVEIGSWKGRSTTWLAAGAKMAGRRVYAIDRHVGSREDPAANTWPDFIGNISRAGVADAVEPLVMSSVEAANVIQGPVELLFIDGDHSYGGVKQDAEIWLPRLAEGGIVLFHDATAATYDGPRRVFRRMICWSNRFNGIRRVGSMGVARRTARRSVRDAAWGTIAGLMLYVFDLKQLLRGRFNQRGGK